MMKKSKALTSTKIKKPTRNCSIPGIVQRYKDSAYMQNNIGLSTGNPYIDNVIKNAYNQAIDKMPMPKLYKAALKQAKNAPSYGAKVARLQTSIYDACHKW